HALLRPIPAGVEPRHQAQHMASQNLILRRELVSAVQRELSCANPRFINFERLLVLREGLPGIPDSADPEAELRRHEPRGVTHEVAVTRPLKRRAPKPARLEREVIHPDLAVTRRFEAGAAELVQRALLGSSRKVGFGEPALAGLIQGTCA